MCRIGIINLLNPFDPTKWAMMNGGKTDERGSINALLVTQEQPKI